MNFSKKNSLDSYRLNIVKSWIRDRIDIIIFILAGLILGLIIGKQPYLAFFMIVGIMIVSFFYNKPVLALSIFIFLLPFYKVPLLNIPVIFKGTEPIYLIATFTIFVGALNVQNSNKLPRLAFILISAMIIVFSISVFRSLDYMELVTMRNIADGRERLSPFEYVLKNLVRPMFFFFPIIAVIKFLKDFKNLELIIKAITNATLVFSVYILFIYFYHVFGRSVAEWGNEYYNAYLGLERNSAANLLIFGFPFFIAKYFIKKSFFNVFSIFLIILAIGFLFTRTAYVTLIFSFILYLIVSKRTKFLPVLLVIGAIGFTFIVSSSIIERASKGLDSGDLNEISAGRVGNQWIPLLSEYFSDPGKLLFGRGIYAIVNSKSVKLGLTPDTMLHPHNMYIEMLIDAGIISLLLILLLMAIIMKKILQYARDNTGLKISEYQFAIFISLASYFLAGITGRSLWPGGKNALFWVILAIGFVFVRLIQERNAQIEKSTGS